MRITHPDQARAQAIYLFEEGFVDDYQITRNALGQTLVLTRVDGEDWTVLFDEADIAYEGEL